MRLMMVLIVTLATGCSQVDDDGVYVGSPTQTERAEVRQSGVLRYPPDWVELSRRRLAE